MRSPNSNLKMNRTQLKCVKSKMERQFELEKLSMRKTISTAQNGVRFSIQMNIAVHIKLFIEKIASLLCEFYVV